MNLIHSKSVFPNLISGDGSKYVKGNGGDEELYADLLKDDIITLDDNLLCATHNPTSIIMNFSESEKYTQLPIQTAMPEVKMLSCQSNATNRVKLKKQEPNIKLMNIVVLKLMNIVVLTFLLVIFVACLRVVWW